MKVQTKIWSLSGLFTLLAISANAQPVNSQITDSVTQANLQAPGATIAIKNNTGKPAWMTIYNFASSIRDSGCVAPGAEIQFHNYYGPLQYRVRAEMTEAAGCAGRVIADIDTSGVVSINAGMDVAIQQGKTGNYYIEKIKLATEDQAQVQTAQAGLENLKVGPGVIRTRNNTGNSMWVTVYNYFSSIRDSGCVKAGETRDWTNYWGPLAFKVRAEVTVNADCGGSKLADLSQWISVDPISGKEMSLEQRQDGSFFWNK